MQRGIYASPRERQVDEIGLGSEARMRRARSLYQVIELLKELLHRLSDVRALVALGGMVMVCGIVFVETGLFVGFFLPGDSLLVTAGVVAADKASGLQLVWLLP